jgi:hypothetical protein
VHDAVNATTSGTTDAVTGTTIWHVQREHELAQDVIIAERTAKIFRKRSA